MQLEGVVTNVTDFGAFVDVGVHQDGLVHISQLSDRFVKDPREVVKVGDKIKVRVIEIDLARRRIALSARSEAGATRTEGPRKEGGRTEERPQRAAGQGQPGQDRGRGGQGQGQSQGPRRAEQSGDRGRGKPERGPERKNDGTKFANNPFSKLGNLRKD